MPSINDIATIAEALEKSPVVVVRDRCVAVRNRNSSCRKCVRACPVRAITVEGNDIKLAAGSCTGCGACVAICPTEALVSAQPTDKELRDAAFASIAANDGRAVIACARISSKRKVDPSRYAEVPCLSRVDEGLVVELAAQGASEVLLVDGNCQTCKYHACSPITDAAVLYAKELLDSCGGQAAVERETGFPEDMLTADARALHGSSRRGFFRQAAGQAVETAKVAAKTTLENELGYKLDETSIGERLRVGPNGTLPLISMARHDAAINALDVIGGPQRETLESRLFGSVQVDVSKCNACGMCAVFCPTGALRRDPTDKPSKPLDYLEFSACECVQCGLCDDVCWKGALTLSAQVGMDQLFDFEPVVFQIPDTARKRRSLFG